MKKIYITESQMKHLIGENNYKTASSRMRAIGGSSKSKGNGDQYNDMLGKMAAHSDINKDMSERRPPKTSRYDANAAPYENRMNREEEAMRHEYFPAVDYNEMDNDMSFLDQDSSMEDYIGDYGLVGEDVMREIEDRVVDALKGMSSELHPYTPEQAKRNRDAMLLKHVDAKDANKDILKRNGSYEQELIRKAKEGSKAAQDSCRRKGLSW